MEKKKTGESLNAIAEEFNDVLRKTVPNA